MELTGIHEQITLARNKKGWSKKELTQALHLSCVQVTDLEKGNSYPSFDTFYKLTEALDVSADVLLRDVHKNFLIYAIDDYISRLKLKDARHVLQTLLLMVEKANDKES